MLNLECASNNPEKNESKEGAYVGVNEMLKLSLADNKQIDFVGQVITFKDNLLSN